MIADKLFELESFKRQYEAVLILSVCDTIPKLIWNENKVTLLSKIDWNNLLGISTILSYSDINSHLEAALRISQTCISEESSNESQKNASAIILSNLTNKPSLNLAVQRNFISKEYKKDFPLIFKLQTLNTDIDNSIFINGKLLSLNKFQKNVHDSYENFETISISAPTSAGKSFILCNILIEEITKSKKNIVYLVPTRALISQVEADLKNLVKKYEINNVNISTVPQNELEEDNSNIFIFTQERLHWFLCESDLRLDLILIDEAHKIDDGNRGILLQQKLEEVVKNNVGIRVYFSSPFTSNPEILLENVNNESSKQIVNTQFISVNQNLIYATQYPRKSDKWNLHLSLPDKKILLGQVNLKERPNTETKKITYLSESISNSLSGNIIYSNGAAESEDKAIILYDLLNEFTTSTKIKELISLIKKTIHKDYSLAKVLDKGIAFHYGNMPLLIRQEIEKLFAEGEIKYLICTSTLLEGINLPAKSIFIRKPTRGRNTPLDENDFWNLAGRAGRWGKEFSGNIVCINPQDWRIPPNPNKSKQKIKRAIDEVVAKKEELIEFIKNNSPRDIAESKQDIESAFGYYYIKFLNNELDTHNELERELSKIFEELKKTIIIPDYIIKRNPGISPIAQQTLYDYFNDNIDAIDEFIPVYPEDDNSYEEYVKLVGRIGTTISNYPEALNNSRAILLINWMKGRPLSFLISGSQISYQNRGSDKKLKTIIREVMENIESFVRFRFARDSGCYIDILRYFLEMNDKKELLDQIPQLNLWLEFGVSQKTHLSLLSLGLTRSTVIELSNYITNTQMSKNECLQWLKEQDFEQFDISTIIVEDILKNIQ
ncbi:DEAD/DEAH box helicase [Flavobacterium sp. 102]|uniref:DEAD/DEAH box helicase n=1 Tax=Flavobacterium sp. 102 TaxID=2135623 RepID=UPI000EAFC0BA|nr:DEAD/DEAH box helicase [Flavobacterium sp. 102]RKS01460.1 helicase-like protein [Flavobacterium sp. 102]